MELKHKVESILFAVGDKISVAEVAKLTRVPEGEIKKVLKILEQEYADRQGPLMVFAEEDLWKLTVKESFLPLVRKIVSRTELPKSVMETLAVLAWKAPMKQSELIEIRSNKGYDHLKELERMGFIIKEPHGRTYLLKLTQKFFDYFELSGKKDIEKKFGKFKNETLIPQKHIEEFKTPEEEKREREEMSAEHEMQRQELTKQYHEQRDQDKGFLSEMDGRIQQKADESKKTQKVFADAMPQVIEEEVFSEEKMPENQD